jgi:hypothetical protein
LEEEQKNTMIAMYSQSTNTDRIGTLQVQINTLMEAEPPKKIKREVVNINDYILKEVPAWQL